MTRPTIPAGPWDPGLQPERNSLAWRRTALGLTAGGTIAARLLTASHPWLSIALPAAALTAGMALLAAAGIRSHRLDRNLRADRTTGPPPTGPSGRLVLTTATLAALLAAVGSWLVLTGHLSAD